MSSSVEIIPSAELAHRLREAVEQAEEPEGAADEAVQAADPHVFVRRVEEGLQGPTGADPTVLADLFGLSLSGGGLGAPLRYTLQKALLRRTVAHARNAAGWYRDDARYQQWIETGPDEPPNLSAWPVIHREDVIENFDAFIAGDVTFRSICHTSGTTGPSLDVYKSVEEVQFLHRFYTRSYEPSLKFIKRRPLILSFPNFYHGVALPLPSIGKVFVGGVTDDTLIQDAVKLLTRRYKIAGHDDRITIVSGLTFHVQLFTSYLIEQGIDPRSFGMTAINVTGGFLSQHWREFLSESWGVAVNDRFSLTEVVGGATRCAQCGGFHLDPNVVGEVLDPQTDEALCEGVGYLVLSNLYPFVQMQPLLRYATGDLIYIAPSECRPGPSFTFLGKRKNCVSWERDGRCHWLVFSAFLHQLLTPLPDLRIFEWFSNVSVVRDRTVGSLPLYDVQTLVDEHGVMDMTLRLELRYAPHCYRHRLNELTRIITDGLREVPHTSFAALMDRGLLRFHVQYFVPGSLDATIKIKI